MIEVNKTHDFLPGTDMQAYGQYAKKAIAKMLQVPGLVEFRLQRNVLGSPQVRSTYVWQTLADWGKFAESTERWTLEAELGKFATNIRLEIWGPSPLLPEPLRPSK
jgi:heme-degrading monooxygenase HmoA